MACRHGSQRFSPSRPSTGSRCRPTTPLALPTRCLCGSTVEAGLAMPTMEANSRPTRQAQQEAMWSCRTRAMGQARLPLEPHTALLGRRRRQALSARPAPWQPSPRVAETATSPAELPLMETARWFTVWKPPAGGRRVRTVSSRYSGCWTRFPTCCASTWTGLWRRGTAMAACSALRWRQTSGRPGSSLPSCRWKAHRCMGTGCPPYDRQTSR